MTDTKTQPQIWLGTRDGHGTGESFPEGTLNSDQVRALLQIEDKGRRIVDLSHTTRPAIYKLTDEIVEVWTEFGRGWPNHCRFVLILNNDGKFIAAIEEKYEGPMGVHPPGAKFRKWAVAYLRTPEMSGNDKAEEREYEHMHCISDKGAVDQVHKFIRETWVHEEATA